MTELHAIAVLVAHFARSSCSSRARLHQSALCAKRSRSGLRACVSNALIRPVLQDWHTCPARNWSMDISRLICTTPALANPAERTSALMPRSCCSHLGMTCSRLRFWAVKGMKQKTQSFISVQHYQSSLLSARVHEPKWGPQERNDQFWRVPGRLRVRRWPDLRRPSSARIRSASSSQKNERCPSHEPRAKRLKR
jgi:hypothetical protein